MTDAKQIKKLMAESFMKMAYPFLMGSMSFNNLTYAISKDMYKKEKGMDTKESQYDFLNKKNEIEWFLFEMVYKSPFVIIRDNKCLFYHASTPSVSTRSPRYFKALVEEKLIKLHDGDRVFHLDMIENQFGFVAKEMYFTIKGE